MDSATEKGRPKISCKYATADTPVTNTTIAWIISGSSQGAWTKGIRIRNIPSLMEGCSAPSARWADFIMIAMASYSFMLVL